MTPETTAPAWPVLSATERRVIGVLVEKAKTTPDAYPLSVNAIVVGSNQKSNRDPLMTLTDEEVDAALAELQHKGLVTRIQGGRVERWRHNLYEIWQVDKAELAILAELLLRGAQTEGELRGRASRMERIDDLDALRAKLKPLAERGLIVFLGEEGRRGTQITHGLGASHELEAARSATYRLEEGPASPAPAGGSKLADRVAELEQKVDELQAKVTRLETALAGVPPLTK